jgi:hypothetical protein
VLQGGREHLVAGPEEAVQEQVQGLGRAGGKRDLFGWLPAHPAEAPTDLEDVGRYRFA